MGAYVIGASTSVDVSGLKGKLDKFDDAYFKPKAEGRKKKGEEEFFEEGKPEKKLEMTAEMVAYNKAVDSVLEKAVAAVPELKGYLQTRFTLSKRGRPHMMKF